MERRANHDMRFLAFMAARRYCRCPMTPPEIYGLSFVGQFVNLRIRILIVFVLSCSVAYAAETPANEASIKQLLDVLPRLNPGVMVHLHDIFLPFEYPRKCDAN